jgi:4-hydroxy-tetrahydrodipicolinate reductase
VIRVTVPGAAGKMGQMVMGALATRGEVATLAAVLERSGHPSIGRDTASGVTITDDVGAALALCDVYIDFTVPAATVKMVELAAQKRVAAVIGTTGLSDSDRIAIDRAAERIPVVLSPNYSLGVTLLCGLVEQAARALGPEFDMEVVEVHHKLKRDAPSGTALAIAEALARGRHLRLSDTKRCAREGEIGPRPPGEIGIMAVRGGDVVGDHTAYFLGPSERIEITHRAENRAVFAQGAVRAALWVVGKPPGLYSMKNVLGLP